MYDSIPVEIETLARTQGLSADLVYEIYLVEFARLERSARIMTFVPIFAWQQTQQRITELCQPAVGLPLAATDRRVSDPSGAHRPAKATVDWRANRCRSRKSGASAMLSPLSS